MMASVVEANGVRLEEARPGDDAIIATNEAACFPLEPLGQQQVAYYRRRREATVLVARNGASGIIGYVVASLDRRRGALALWIVTMAVLPGARRQGLGRRLLEKVTALGRKHRANRVKLQVGVRNLPARQLYESCGFEVVRRLADFYGHGRHAYLMERPLSRAVAARQP